MTEFTTVNSDPQVRQLLAIIENNRSRIYSAYRGLLSGAAQGHHLTPLENLRTSTGDLQDTPTARAMLLLDVEAQRTFARSRGLVQVGGGLVPEHYGFHSSSNLQVLPSSNSSPLVSAGLATHTSQHPSYTFFQAELMNATLAVDTDLAALLSDEDEYRNALNGGLTQVQADKLVTAVDRVNWAVRYGLALNIDPATEKVPHIFTADSSLLPAASREALNW